MTDDDYRILMYRVSGMTPQEIAKIDGRSVSRIKAIIYDERFKHLVQQEKERRDSRSNHSPSDRMADVVGKALASLEREIDATAGNDKAVLTLIPKMVELGRVVPPSKGKLSELGVAILPEMDDEKTFNGRTLTANPGASPPETPTPAGITPGGSKTPTPTHNMVSNLPHVPESPPAPPGEPEEDVPSKDERDMVEEEIRNAAGGW